MCIDPKDPRAFDGSQNLCYEKGVPFLNVIPGAIGILGEGAMRQCV